MLGEGGNRMDYLHTGEHTTSSTCTQRLDGTVIFSWGTSGKRPCKHDPVKFE